MRRVGDLQIELLDEPRLANARLADDQRDLAFTCPSAFPAARKHA